MTAKPGSWWQKIKTPLAVIAAIALLASMLVLLILTGYRVTWTGFFNKTLWDWLNLLGVLAIPVVVGLGAAWFTAQQGKVSDRQTKDNQRETALQAYIDKISELLLKEHLGERTADGQLKPEYEQVRKIARVRTITVLTQLDARRIGYVFTFLREAGLMSARLNDDAVSLSHADLRAVNWSQADLRGANLSQAELIGANLSRAHLTGGATLIVSDLTGANLSKANLFQACLYSANLAGANLFQATLIATDLRTTNLSEADLTGANLSRADLREAILSQANLSGADLREAKVAEEQLEKAKSLKGATMPDGSKHP